MDELVAAATAFAEEQLGVELTLDTISAIGILVGVLVLKLVQRKKNNAEREAQEALDAATPPDLRSLLVAGGMLACYLLAVPLGWQAVTLGQAPLPTEEELAALAPELLPVREGQGTAGGGIIIDLVVALPGSAEDLCSLPAVQMLGTRKLARGCRTSKLDWERGEVVSASELLPLTVPPEEAGANASPGEALPLVVLPCLPADEGLEETVTVGGDAKVAWTCIWLEKGPEEWAKAIKAAVESINGAIEHRLAGTTAAAEAEAAAARLMPLNRAVLTLAVEDGAEDGVEGWEGGGAAVHSAMAGLSAGLEAALGGAVVTESHVLRHVELGADSQRLVSKKTTTRSRLRLTSFYPSKTPMVPGTIQATRAVTRAAFSMPCSDCGVLQELR